jgi:hypothetical protein
MRWIVHGENATTDHWINFKTGPLKVAVSPPWNGEAACVFVGLHAAKCPLMVVACEGWESTDIDAFGCQTTGHR